MHFAVRRAFYCLLSSVAMVGLNHVARIQALRLFSQWLKWFHQMSTNTFQNPGKLYCLSRFAMQCNRER